MADDIVTRLAYLCSDHILDGYETEQEWLLEAISEIRFLRQQVEMWKRLGTIEPFMKSYSKARWGND